VSWVGVLAVAAGLYLQKLIGLLVPPRVVTDRPRLARAAERLPAAQLAALVLVSAATTGHRLVLDPRAAGLAAAVGLLLLRAPLLLVVVGASAVTALVRALA